MYGVQDGEFIPIHREVWDTLSKQHSRRKFGNPTPLALAGLVLALTPLSCQLMGWRGSDPSGIINNGAHIWCGGFLMLLGGLLEFFLGNTFAFVVFCAYGGFFSAYGYTLSPVAGLEQFMVNGELSHEFYNTYAFFYLFVGLLSFVFLICSLRTNICFVGIFAAYTIAFPMFAGEYWAHGQGNMKLVTRLQVGGGAACFVVSLLGWWVFLATMLDSVDFPLDLPLGDLSALVPGRKNRLEGVKKSVEGEVKAKDMV